MKSNLEIQVNNQPQTFNAEVILYRRVDRNDIEVLSFRAGVMEWDNYQANGSVRVEPTMIVPQDMVHELVQVFANEARKRGIPVADESFAKGKLEATEQHLRDMRKLVFEDREEINTQDYPVKIV